MSADDDFAAFAAAFIQSQQEESYELPPAEAEPDDGLTTDAREVLQSVTEGGVPAFVTANLLRIAAENGIAVTADWTPNQIIEALQAIRRSAGSP